MVCPLPLRLIEALIVSGLDGPMDLLEQLVVEWADAARFGGPTLKGISRAREGFSLLLLRRGSGFVPIESENDGVAGLTVAGPAEGASVTVRPTGDQFRAQSLRPLAKVGFELADQMFGTHLGPFR